MILTGDPIDAGAALRYRLVQRVVPRERLYAEAEALAREILALPTHAVTLARRAVREGAELSLAAAVALESRLVEQALLARQAT
jgi:enoyl-CoA hydratase/carnithine racemase